MVAVTRYRMAVTRLKVLKASLLKALVASSRAILNLSLASESARLVLLVNSVSCMRSISAAMRQHSSRQLWVKES